MAVTVMSDGGRGAVCGRTEDNVYYMYTLSVLIHIHRRSGLHTGHTVYGHTKLFIAHEYEEYQYVYGYVYTTCIYIGTQ